MDANAGVLYCAHCRWPTEEYGVHRPNGACIVRYRCVRCFKATGETPMPKHECTFVPLPVELPDFMDGATWELDASGEFYVFTLNLQRRWTVGLQREGEAAPHFVRRASYQFADVLSGFMLHLDTLVGRQTEHDDATQEQTEARTD